MVEGEPVPWSELKCPDRLPRSSEQCAELLRLQTRRILFDAMLERAAARATGDGLGALDRQVDEFVRRMAPTRERYAMVMRCHAQAALRELGEAVPSDPDCSVDPGQVSQLARSLSRRELRELTDQDIGAEIEAGQVANLRAELALAKIRQYLQSGDRTEASFWQEVYREVGPVFYDAGLYMNASEVITGDPRAWEQS